jgi:hypothetical protein
MQARWYGLSVRFKGAIVKHLRYLASRRRNLPQQSRAEALPLSVGEHYRIELAPFSQRALRRFLLEIVPLFERAPSYQQLPEASVGAAPAEHVADVVKVSRQDLTDEIHHQRYAEIELSGNWMYFSSSSISSGSSSSSSSRSENSEIPVDLARLPAEIGVMLAILGAAHAGEFVGLHEFLEAYGHGHLPCRGSPRAYVISAQLAATVARSRSRVMNTSLERRSLSGQRASRVGGWKVRCTPSRAAGGRPTRRGPPSASD